jgi:hypothetical protein
MSYPSVTSIEKMVRGPASCPQNCSWFITCFSVDVDVNEFHVCSEPIGKKARGSWLAGLSKTCLTPRRHSRLPCCAERKMKGSGS